MTENQPLVSVIIPVYNGERYLSQALESVMAQTYQPIEIIVVDDGSTDRSADVAKHFELSVRYHLEPHGGIGAARNSGIHLAQGNYFAFLDADDLWVEDKLERQIKAFNDDTGLDMVFGHVRQFYSPDLAASVKEKVYYTQEVMPAYSPSTLLIRREAFFRVGFFATNWRVGEFIDWYLKATDQGLKSSMLSSIMLRRRIHSDNTGIRHRDYKSDYLRILKASIDRRRGQIPHE